MLLPLFLLLSQDFLLLPLPCPLLSLLHSTDPAISMDNTFHCIANFITLIKNWLSTHIVYIQLDEHFFNYSFYNYTKIHSTKICPKIKNVEKNKTSKDRQKKQEGDRKSKRKSQKNAFKEVRLQVKEMSLTRRMSCVYGVQ